MSHINMQSNVLWSTFQTTALDKGSRYFEGRGQMQLKSSPQEANEVF